MKRVFPVLLCLLLICACADTAQNTYRGAAFTATLPEGFEPVKSTPFTCFAPNGDPLRSSSISFSSTEKNWYFDGFTEAEYNEALESLCGYESITVTDIESCRVDGFDARRIACKTLIDQGTHDLIIYAINADQTYFVTLLNRDGDSYIAAFDEMMSAMHFTGEK